VDSKRSRERVDLSVHASVIVCACTEERRPRIQMALDSIARQTVAPQKAIAVIDHNPALCERPEEGYPKIEVRLSWLPEEFSGSWDAAIAGRPRPRRRSTIPWARSGRGALGEALG
jgi:hypothetical protein